MENRHGLCLEIAVSDPSSHYGCVLAGVLLDRTQQRHGLCPRTLRADGNYKAGAFLAALEGDGITPHVRLPDGPAAAAARGSAKRRMKTKGYTISQRVRKRVEELIGWCKMVGGLARAGFIGRWNIQQQSEATAAAYNLLRLARVAPAGWQPPAHGSRRAARSRKAVLGRPATRHPPHR
jgi:hypothetical protein